MKTATRIPGQQRRASIIETASAVFVEKGFNGTTTRELAEAAGVSEALLFKHFPSKEALYTAILTSCFEADGSKILKRVESLEPCTSTLVFMVRDLISHLFGGGPDEGACSFFRLIIRSLMDEGEFTRLALQGAPSRWVQKVKQCAEAAKAAGDMLNEPIRPGLSGWFVHQLITGLMVHSLPGQSVIDYGVSSAELANQVMRFCLLGMGVKEEAIRRDWDAGNMGVR